MHIIAFTPAIEDRLFEALKDSDLFTTLANGNVKMRNGSTNGEWKFVGGIINPRDKENGIRYAEQLFWEEKKVTKRLRARISAWRKANPSDTRVAKYPDAQFDVDRTPPKDPAKELLQELLDANKAVEEAYGCNKAHSIAIAAQEVVESKVEKFLKTG